MGKIKRKGDYRLRCVMRQENVLFAEKSTDGSAAIALFSLYLHYLYNI